MWFSSNKQSRRIDKKQTEKHHLTVGFHAAFNASTGLIHQAQRFFLFLCDGTQRYVVPAPLLTYQVYGMNLELKQKILSFVAFLPTILLQ